MCELLHYFAGFPKKMQIDGWLREKGPALLAGPRGQSCSAGGWVVSRSRAHSQFGTVELVPDGSSPAVIPGEGGNGLAVPRVVIARGCAPHAQPPEWPPPRAEAKDKKVRAPPARASPNGPGGPQHRLPTVQNYFDIGNATQASLTAAKASEFSGSRRKSESDSGAGGKKSKVLLLGPMAKKQGFVARSPCWLVHNIMPCRPTR
jgi:hypothetical protein